MWPGGFLLHLDWVKYAMVRLLVTNAACHRKAELHEFKLLTRSVERDLLTTPKAQ